MPPSGQNSDFHDLLERVFTGFSYANTRDINSHIESRFVAFIDMLGFQQMVTTSTAGAVQLLTRFHRCLNKAFPIHSLDADFADVPTPYHVVRFTDCAFVIFRASTAEVISSLVYFLNLLLAINARVIVRGLVTPIHPYLLPRVTLTFGEVLELRSAATHKRLEGLDIDSVLAGSGIVHAYRLEKLSPPFGLFVDRFGVGRIKETIGFSSDFLDSPLQFVLSFGEVTDVYENYRRQAMGIELPWLLFNVAGQLAEKYEQSDGKDILIGKGIKTTESSFLERWKILRALLQNLQTALRTNYGTFTIDASAGKNLAQLDRMLADQYSLFMNSSVPLNPSDNIVCESVTRTAESNNLTLSAPNHRVEWDAP
jgi:hypothetical protein